MRKRGFKVISLSDTTDYKKPKIDWMKIATIVGGIAGGITVLIAVIAIIVDIKLDEKAEIQYKPLIDIKIEYYQDDYYNDIHLDENGKYISKLLITAEDGNAEAVNVIVEPFYNIIYYNQKERSLIKQLLPISDVHGVSIVYAPLEVNTMGLNHDNICEISLNQNTYNLVKNMTYLFEDTPIVYDDMFSKIMPDMIIASIDFEYYITIDCIDRYGNEYTDVYLCETGFRKFSGYLTDFVYEYDEEKVNDDIMRHNMECIIDYIALKADNIDNLEFDARLSKISEQDIFYVECHSFFEKLIETTNAIAYIPNMVEDIEALITYGYNSKQLLFSLDNENKIWEKSK